MEWSADTDIRYSSVMHELHGKNVWHDSKLQPMLQLLGV